jgi:tRNA nucleotidyltransferase/poly(A) polymerase
LENRMKFKNDHQLAEYIQSLGGDLWLVGGAVRDQLMFGKANDHDYLITGLNPNDLPFKKVVGNAFPVFLVRVGGVECEVALARKEVKVGKGYKGFDCYAGADVTLEEDLARRDLTINAMAIHVLSGRLADPFHGQEDIQKKLIRHTTEAFVEDPLRVYRVARFTSRFSDFQVHLDTIEIMRNMKTELRELSSERVWKELEKALLSAMPERFFQVLAEADLLSEHFAELPGNADFSLLSESKELKHRFGLLSLLVSNDENIPDKIKELCGRITAPRNLEKFALLSVQWKDSFIQLNPAAGEAVVPMVLKTKADIPDLIQILFSYYKRYQLTADDQLEIKWINAVEKVLQIEQRVTGKMLLEEGLKPGKELGDILLQRRIRAYQSETFSQ